MHCAPLCVLPAQPLNPPPPRQADAFSKPHQVLFPHRLGSWIWWFHIFGWLNNGCTPYPFASMGLPKQGEPVRPSVFCFFLTTIFVVGSDVVVCQFYSKRGGFVMLVVVSPCQQYSAWHYKPMLKKKPKPIPRPAAKAASKPAPKGKHVHCLRRGAGLRRASIPQLLMSLTGSAGMLNFALDCRLC